MQNIDFGDIDMDISTFLKLDLDLFTSVHVDQFTSIKSGSYVSIDLSIIRSLLTIQNTFD